MGFWGLYLRGLLMGAADLVPGISGGTVALLSGIYPRLIGALSRCDQVALGLLLRRRWRPLAQHIDGALLLPLGLGMASALLALAQLLHWLLQAYPLPLWSLFLGLLAGAGWQLLRGLPRRHWPALLAGLLVSLALALVNPGAGVYDPQGWALLSLVGAGALAICAMILPGISGSFILLLLGVYGYILAALVQLQWLPLLLFGIGCGLGLLAFSRLLHWALGRWPEVLMSALGGLMLGALIKLWPWQAEGAWYWPGAYPQEPMLGACLAALGAGLALAYWGARRPQLP